MSFRTKCSVATCALSGLLGGLCLSSFSGLLELRAFSENFPNLSTSDKSWLSAALLFGAFTCTIVSGRLVDLKGKRIALCVSAVLFTAGSVAIACASTKWELGFGRALSGCGYAIANIAAPAYLTESAPSAYRAIFVNIYQMMINVGIVTAQVANALSVKRTEWRTAAAVGILPGLLMVFLGVLLFENECNKESGKSHDNSSGGGSGNGLRATIALIRADESSYRRLAISAVMLMGGQQLSGVNAIIFYGPVIVMQMGMGGGSWISAESAPFWAAVLVGGANCAASMFAMGYVDKRGRRDLLTRGGGIICVSLCVLGFVRWNGGPSIVGVISLVTFIGGFAVSWGPLPFVVSAEVLPYEWRGIGLTVAGLVSHACSSGVVAGFLMIEERIGAGAYMLFASLMLGVSISVIKWLPETKGKTLQEIDVMLRRGGCARSSVECV